MGMPEMPWHDPPFLWGDEAMMGSGHFAYFGIGPLQTTGIQRP